MWLTERLAPDHETIADFRHDNGIAIRKTRARFVELGRRIRGLKGECVAIDGSRFKAVNHRDENFTEGETTNWVIPLEASTGRYIDEMVRVDRQEEGKARGGTLANLRRRTGRIRSEIQRLPDKDHALNEAPVNQILLTDPDPGSMATSTKGTGFVGCEQDRGHRAAA